MKLKTIVPISLFLMLGLSCATPTGEDGSTLSNSESTESSSETTTEGSSNAATNSPCRQELAQLNCAIKKGKEMDELNSAESGMFSKMKQVSNNFLRALGDENKCAAEVSSMNEYTGLIKVSLEEENMDITSFDDMVSHFGCKDAELSSVPGESPDRELSFDEIRAVYVCTGNEKSVANLDNTPEAQREGTAKNLQSVTQTIISQTGCTPEGIKLER